MFATTLETIQSTESKRAAYTRGILALLAIAVVLKAVWLWQVGLGHGRELVDFAAFYITAKLVWLGDMKMNSENASSHSDIGTSIATAPPITRTV